jgi:pimeloyl-ACP methyl ester carboxylesterase
MMVNFGTYPAFEMAYDTGGHLVDPSSEADLIQWLLSNDGKPTTDLIFISHGWNNDMNEARQLYAAFFASMASVQRTENVAPQKKFAVAAIFWPSKRFADSDLIPGGAAAVGPSVSAQLNTQLDQLTLILAADPTAADKIEHAREQIPKLEVSQSAQNDFVFALASALPPVRGEKDEAFDDAINSVISGSVAGHVVLARLSKPVFPAFPITGGSGGHALGLGGILDGITSAASRLANLFTYYTMKDRAGIVGRTGVVQSILHVQSEVPALRIHLIGHSFGGRLVTAAANALSAPRAIATLMLLEAAYSHNGLGQDWDGAGNDGAFRPVMSRPEIAGNTLITHSVHDTAVGIAYPLASRLMNQTAAALGDANDKFGGMGRNGAQHTPEAFDDFLLPVGQVYAPLPAGKTIRNLNGDGPAPKPTITSHGDVTKPEILWAWLSSL